MNPEEFDKRLSESFRSEHLPPDKRLWENISSRLDENRKKPLWFWLIPVIVVVAAIGWLIGNNASQKRNIASETNTQTSISKTDVVAPVEKTESTSTDKSVTENTVVTQGSINNKRSASYINADKITKAKRTDRNNSTSSSLNNVETPVEGHANNLSQNTNDQNTLPGRNTRDENISNEEGAEQTSLKMEGLVSPSLSTYDFPKEELIAYDFPFKNKKTYKSPYSKNPVNYDSKWWWSAGLGPQVAFNKAIVPNDSQEWVHKELWANRSKMTANGTGFHSQFLVGRKLGKHFSLETGLQYSRHTEDIRFDFMSYDIEFRDQNDKILAYNRYLLALYIGLDTTWYDATRAFSLSVKNRYNIYTIPLKFNFEVDVSDKTKLVAGIGAGFSAITCKKTTHLNLINDQETVDKKVRQFTASLNAQLGFYTNFNDIGQLGIYSGFQMYTKPWEVGNKQYAIQMSDLQLGISFRRPLNW